MFHTLKKRNIDRRIIGAVTFFLFFSFFNTVYSASLTSVSDLISTSNPNIVSTHTITFTTTNAVPASGSIRIIPQSNALNIPALFDYTDADLAVGAGPLVDRPLDSVPSAINDGVAVVSGTSGSITFNLNTLAGISAGTPVEIEFGLNATFGGVGDQSFVNSVAPGSYKIDIETRDQFGNIIDSAKAMIVIITPVTVGPVTVVSTAPIRSNGLPSGVVAAGSETIELSLNTNELAVCKYATSAGVDYSAMTNTFIANASSTLHTTVLSGFLDSTAYTFYVRCIDEEGNFNTDDYLISFSLRDPVLAGEGFGGTGASTQPKGPIAQGSRVLYTSSITFTGASSPLSVIQTLKDAVKENTVFSGNDGSFSTTITALERGVYTFVLYATDSQNRISSTVSTSLSLQQNTNNGVSDIIIPPTIELFNDTVDIGSELLVFGESVPSSTIVLTLFEQVSDGTPITRVYYATTTSESGLTGVSGVWSKTIDTTDLKLGTYELSAISRLTKDHESGSSRVLFSGIGTSPDPKFDLRADINRDGFVNLIDFSILLFHWGTGDAFADINSDGTTNIIDFSIMLTFWTG